MPDISNELETIRNNVYGDEVVDAIVTALRSLNEYPLSTMDEYKEWFDMVTPFLEAIEISRASDSAYAAISNQVDSAIQAKVNADVESFVEDKVEELVDQQFIDSVAAQAAPQIAANILLSVYPKDSIYMSTSNVNPGTLFGGTWIPWGSGKVPVGVNTGDSYFNTVEKTGGNKTITLTKTQIPVHNHTQAAHKHTIGSHSHSGPAHSHTLLSHTHSLNSHTHTVTPGSGNSFLRSNDSTFNNLRYRVTAVQPAGAVVETAAASSGVLIGTPTSSSKLSLVATITSGAASGSTGGPSTNSTGTEGTGLTGASQPSCSEITPKINNAFGNSSGGTDAFNNCMPYITCYMWKRTA